MSFILDALRKSENSRLRQDHPAVFSHRLAPVRRRWPTWGLVLIALLSLNFGVVVFVLLRETLNDAEAPMSSAAPAIVAVPRGHDPFAPIATPPPLVATPMPTTPIAAETLASPTKSINSTTTAATRDDLLARGANLPTTDLNMHVYDANPQLRFILLNGQRLREGESSREGLAVERITPEGVVLRFGNQTFAVNLP